MHDDILRSRSWQVDDLGGLLAVVCANARSIEAKRGMLGHASTGPAASCSLWRTGGALHSVQPRRGCQHGS